MLNGQHKLRGNQQKNGNHVLSPAPLSSTDIAICIFSAFSPLFLMIPTFITLNLFNFFTLKLFLPFAGNFDTFITLEVLLPPASAVAWPPSLPPSLLSQWSVRSFWSCEKFWYGRLIWRPDGGGGKVRAEQYFGFSPLCITEWSSALVANEHFQGNLPATATDGYRWQNISSF